MKINNRTTLFLNIFLGIITLQLHATEFRPGTIFTTDNDTLKVDIFFAESTPGIVSYKGGDGQIRVIRADEISVLSIEEGKTYSSRQIFYNNRLQYILLETHTQPPHTLLSLQFPFERIFLETEGLDLTELNPQNFHTTLREVGANCSNWQQQLPILKFKTSHIANALKPLNKNRCGIIPMSSLGITLQAHSAVFTLDKNAFTQALQNKTNAESQFTLLGIYLQLPILAYPNTQIGFNFSYSTQTFEYKTVQAQTQQELWFEYEQFSLEVLPRWIYPRYKIQPYITAGPGFTYNKNTGSAFAMTRPATTGFEEVEINNFLSIPDFFISLGAGAGIQYFYLPGYYISMEVKNSYLFGKPNFSVNHFSVGLKANILHF